MAEGCFLLLLSFSDFQTSFLMNSLSQDLLAIARNIGPQLPSLLTLLICLVIVLLRRRRHPKATLIAALGLILLILHSLVLLSQTFGCCGRSSRPSLQTSTAFMRFWTGCQRVSRDCVRCFAGCYFY
mgnify:CR=1 FL=1